MDYETVSAEEFGRSLTGVGINLLVRDVRRHAAFLTAVFGLTVSRLSDDFAIATHQGSVFQLHRDQTFASHPLLALVPEAEPRGAGAQFYLFGVDPDLAASRALAAEAVVLEAPTDKPHGLRECVILDPDGYAWSPAVRLG